MIYTVHSRVKWCIAQPPKAKLIIHINIMYIIFLDHVQQRVPSADSPAAMVVAGMLEDRQ